MIEIHCDKEFSISLSANRERPNLNLPALVNIKGDIFRKKCHLFVIFILLLYKLQ